MTTTTDAEAGSERPTPLDRQWWLSYRGLAMLVLWVLLVVDADASGPSLYVNTAIVLVAATFTAWALATVFRRVDDYLGGRDG